MKDALDELLDRYAPDAGAMWLAAETPDIVPEHPFSPKFRRRMDRLIRRQGRSPAVTAALRCARRAAAYALVLLTLSFSCLMTVDTSFREQVLRVVVEVPKNLSSEQKKLLRSFEEATGEKNYQKRRSFFDKIKDAFNN